MIATQVKLGEAIEKIHINYKKEPKQRLKQSDRLEIFLNDFKENWNAFVENHAKLDAQKDQLVEQPYFQRNYYSKIKLIFNAMNSDIKLRGSFIRNDLQFKASGL